MRAANRGPLAARDAVIDVRLPPALTFEPWPASPAECVEMDGHVTCAVGSIVVGSIFMPLYLDGPRGYDDLTWSNVMTVVGFCPAVECSPQ